MKFMKKKETYNYFDEFIKNAGYIVKSAEILEKIVKNYDKKILEESVVKVHKLENEADEALHALRNYLIKDFLPPIDREDIILIGHKLDDIEDDIDEILINLNIYNIQKLRKEMTEFTELLVKCCKGVEECLVELKKSRKLENLQDKIIEINQLEEKGDKIFEKAMKELYTKEKDAVEIIRWTEMFRCLENAIDTCEHVADCIEDVIMKNS